MNIAEFEKQLTYLLAKIARLEGRRQELAARNAQLESSVGLAKGRQAVSGEVEEFLTAYQNRVHSKAVEDIQALLSYAAVDVLQTQKTVKLELETSRGAPALNFFVENEGNLEDILDGQGGALTNAIVTGLRYLALIRTKNRRLISLDESDCWIKPSRITGYAKFIADVSSLMQVQTLFVSHHAVDLLEQYATVHRLQHDGVGGCEIVLDNVPATNWESDEQVGLRQIWLVDFMSHADTKIDLYPGVNVLTGDNDKGKSTVLNTALRVLAYNQGTDAHIRHGAEEAHVILTLENNVQISYVRKRKGSPKAIYRMWKDGVLQHEGPAVGGLPPSWVGDFLNMPMVNDMEVHVGSQKSPIFLLDESPSTRAQILSLGKESDKLVQVMDEHKKQKSQDSHTVNSGESELTLNKNRLAELQAVDYLQAEVRPIVDQLAAFKDAVKRQEALQVAGKGIVDLCEGIRHNTRLKQSLSELPSVPELKDTKLLNDVLIKLPVLEKTSNLEKPPKLPELPVIRDLSGLGALGSSIVSLQAKARVSKVGELPEIPKLRELTSLAPVLDGMDSLLKQMPVHTAEIKNIVVEKEVVEKELAALLEEVGHSCPLCGSAVMDVSELTHDH